MQGMTAATYILGFDAAEIARLDAQSARIAQPTRALLRAAGIAPGMRVLDLGTGLGAVAFELAELVGPSGAVVGVDQSAPLLQRAEARRAAAGLMNVRFVEAGARTDREGKPVD